MVRTSLGWWSERSQRIDQKSRHRPKWGQHPRHPADSSVHREQMHPRWFSCAAKSLQSCPTLYDPIAGIPPGSPVPGIL